MYTRQTRAGFLAPGRAALVLSFLVLPALAACELDRILEVEIPGKVREEALNDVALAETLVRGVIADVECAWNQYTAGAALHSDEYIPTSGNLVMRNWGQRKITADDEGFAKGRCGEWGFPMYTPLHTARFQGEDVFRRLENFADLKDKIGKQATVRAYGAFPLLALGEGFCAVSVPEKEGEPGPLLMPKQVLELAEKKFSEAIDLATQAGNTEILNMALVGRARARLDLGKFSEASADASRVPPGYRKVATRDESVPRRYNYFFERMNARSGFRQHGSVADHYRNLTIDPQGRPTQNNGVPDPRVNVRTDGKLASDFATLHWYHDKYNSRGDPVPLASYKEAQLFMAEAAARTGDLATARRIINERRTALGLPPFNLPATQDEMIALVLEERRRELFVEGGHRLNDMLRFRGTKFQIPFLGEPGSIHPNGVDQTGAEYGTTTCFPLPLVEESGNPNIKKG